jgi:hypothetical protein
MQGPAGWVQVQPVPLRLVAVRPEGTVSVTVTGPKLGASPMLLTVMVYWALLWPRVKFPVWDLLMARLAPAVGAVQVGNLKEPMRVFQLKPVVM